VARLTILMPVGPAPRPHFPAALRSLANDLPSPDAHLLVVFDGTQPTPQEHLMLERLGGQIALLDKCRSLGQALNSGLDLVATPLTSRFDADDLWPPGRLSRQLRFMEANPACAVAGSDATTIDSEGRVLGYLRGGHGGDLRRSLLIRNQLIHPTTVFRTALARRAGGYPDVHRVEDYALWLRLAQLGSVLNCRERWVSYRIHSRQLSRAPISRSEAKLLRSRRGELGSLLRLWSIYPSLAQLAWSAAQVGGRHGFQHLWSRFAHEPAP
jgi:glycosyl transferase family 2